MHSFTPTLTLTHHEDGWNGTFGQMLNAMAGVLDDGPVAASITYWSKDARAAVKEVGTWDRYEPRGVVTFTTASGVTLTIEDDSIQALSI